MLNEAFEANKTPAERERDDQIAANLSKMASFGLMPTNTTDAGGVGEPQPGGLGGVSTPPAVASKQHASAAAPSSKPPPKAKKGGKAETQGGAIKAKGDAAAARPFDAKAIEAACDIGLALGGSSAVDPLPSSVSKPGSTGQGEKRGREEAPKNKSHKKKAK